MLSTEGLPEPTPFIRCIQQSLGCQPPPPPPQTDRLILTRRSCCASLEFMLKDSSQTVSPMQNTSDRWHLLTSCSFSPQVTNSWTFWSLRLNLLLLSVLNLPKLELSGNRFNWKTWRIHLQTCT